MRTRGFWPDDRTATEARARFPSLVSAFAERERWSGIRTRDSMIISHLLYQLSYPRSDIERYRFDPAFVWRNTVPQSDPRQPGPTARARGLSEGTRLMTDPVRGGKHFPPAAPKLRVDVGWRAQKLPQTKLKHTIWKGPQISERIARCGKCNDHEFERCAYLRRHLLKLRGRKSERATKRSLAILVNVGSETKFRKGWRW